MQSIQSEPEMGFMEFINDLHEHMSEGDTVKIQSLINEIAKYDVFDFIARISSLNLLIENQNKSILFDALIAGLLTNDRAMYTGTVKMSSGKFRNIIGRLEDLQLKSMVDPAENAFIERVLHYGNHWIFPGINYFPSYTLQGFLDALYLQNLQTVEKFIQKSNQMINLTLEISDRIVRLMGYNLDSINHIEQSRIKVPDSRLAETMKHCVCLDYSFVEALMPDESLRQSLFVEFENKELAQVVNGQQQEFFPHPFLKANNGEIILLNPSILASFTIHQLVLLADSYGIKKQLIDAYNNEIWQKCRQDLRNLGHKKIKESEYGITLMNNQHRKEEILAVGSNKLLFVQFICDSGDSYDSHSMFSQQIMEPDTPPNRARAEYFIKNLPFADWENVYQIVILNSFGRSIGAKVAEGEQQYSIHLSPFELHCISVNEQKHSEFLAIADYGDMIDSDVKRAARSTIAEEVAKQTLISIDLVEKIIDQITLCQRPDFLIPPEPYKKYDVYPWRFNRDLSFTRRPIIEYNGDLIWGNRQLHHMWRYTVDLIMSGKYKARRPKLKQLIGKLSDKRGNDFNAAVAQKLSSIDGLIVREKLSKINGKKIVDKNNNVLGDIDVLYIIPEKRKIVVGEVKDFSVAKNPYEMDQEYKRIFVDGEKPCYMTKHKRRAIWIKDHLEDVKAHFNLPEGKWSVKTVMFVSEEIVSNLFYHQGEHIIIYSNITKKTVGSV